MTLKEIKMENEHKATKTNRSMREHSLQQTHTYNKSNWFSTKVNKQFSGERFICSTTGAGTIRYRYARIWAYTKLTQKGSLTWCKIPNYKHSGTRRKALWSKSDKHGLDATPKAYSFKEQTDNTDSSKLKTFALQLMLSTDWKHQPQVGRKFTHHIKQLYPLWPKSISNPNDHQPMDG